MGDSKRSAISLRDTGERVIPEYVRDDDELAANIYAQHLERYRIVAGKVSGARVLDLACGAGFGTRMLAEGGAHEVIGVDRDPEVIRYAARYFAGTNIQFCAGTVETLAPDRFDVIACLETLEHIPNPNALLRELVARLAPGGTLFVSATTVPTCLLYQYHLHDFDEAEFLSLLTANGLRVGAVVRQHFYATPKMVRRSIALHPRASAPRFLFKKPIRFLTKLISACLLNGLHYHNCMAECSIAD